MVLCPQTRGLASPPRSLDGILSVSAAFAHWKAQRPCRRTTPLARFFALISKCRPAVIFGEQVAGPDRREWLSGVRADLEATGYACGASDLCAAGTGAPHNRPRLYWVADADRKRWAARNTGSSRMGTRAFRSAKP